MDFRSRRSPLPDSPSSAQVVSPAPKKPVRARVTLAWKGSEPTNAEIDAVRKLLPSYSQKPLAQAALELRAVAAVELEGLSEAEAKAIHKRGEELGLAIVWRREAP